MALNIRTGTLTSPKEIEPLQMALAIRHVLLGMPWRNRARGRLLDEVEHPHAVDEDDRAPEPAAERQEHIAPEGKREGARADFAVLVAAVADDGGEDEEERRDEHHEHVEGGGPPEW